MKQRVVMTESYVVVQTNEEGFIYLWCRYLKRVNDYFARLKPLKKKKKVHVEMIIAFWANAE